MYWRHLYAIGKIDLCGLIGGKYNAIPLVEGVKNLVYRIAPFLPRKCPGQPGKYYGHNLSISNNIGLEETRLLTPTLPNGVYKLIWKFYDPSEDKEGVTILINHEVYEVDNVDNLMK